MAIPAAARGPYLDRTRKQNKRAGERWWQSTGRTAWALLLVLVLAARKTGRAGSTTLSIPPARMPTVAAACAGRGHGHGHGHGQSPPRVPPAFPSPFIFGRIGSYPKSAPPRPAPMRVVRLPMCVPSHASPPFNVRHRARTSTRDVARYRPHRPLRLFLAHRTPVVPCMAMPISIRNMMTSFPPIARTSNVFSMIPHIARRPRPARFQQHLPCTTETL